jgi:uncharacterized membrane protein YqhA
MLATKTRKHKISQIILTFVNFRDLVLVAKVFIIMSKKEIENFSVKKI